MTEIKERGDRMAEACGVFGIYAQDEAINVADRKAPVLRWLMERALSIIATSALCRRCLTKKFCTG